jgi:hypothetical protein
LRPLRGHWLELLQCRQGRTPPPGRRRRSRLAVDGPPAREFVHGPLKSEFYRWMHRPLLRWVEVCKQPAKRVGFHRIGRQEDLVNMIAGRTLECAQVQPRRTRFDMREQHPRMAGGAPRTLNFRNRDAVRRGIKFGHDASLASLNQAGARHSQSPVMPAGGAVMEPA